MTCRSDALVSKLKSRAPLVSSEKVTPSIGINFCMSDLTWEK